MAQVPLLALICRENLIKTMAEPDRYLILLEDNPLILLDMQTCLTELGYAQVLPASSLEEAQALLDNYPDAAALLDINIRGTSSFSLALALQQQNRKFGFLTGYGTLNMPAELKATPTLRKPVQVADLDRMVGRLFGETGSTTDDK